MSEAKARQRRSILKAAGAGLVAAAIPSVTAEAGSEDRRGQADFPPQPRPVYVHGCGWNRQLPGVYGELCLKFEMRAELNGTGVGTFGDDVHPEVNSQFQITRASKVGNQYTFEGEIIASRDPSLVGEAVKIVAQRTGDGLGKASLTVGSESQNLVVIAIIAVLIGMLTPHYDW